MTKWLIAGYILGTVLHWVFKAWAVKAAPESSVYTWREWVRRNRRAMATRFVIETAIFIGWCYDPSLIEWFKLNPGTALLYGFGFDNVLYLAAAKWKILDGQIPGYNGDGPIVAPPVPAPPAPPAIPPAGGAA